MSQSEIDRLASAKEYGCSPFIAQSNLNINIINDHIQGRAYTTRDLSSCPGIDTVSVELEQLAYEIEQTITAW